MGGQPKQVGRHNNCLNVIRLIAALQVLFGHAYVHLNVEHIMVGVGDSSIDIMLALHWVAQSIPGVPTFFFLSGFLIWDSIGRSSGFKHYVKKRIFRVFPELWVAVLVEMLSILLFYKKPIIWTKFILFGVAQGTLFQFWTPDFLREYGCGVPNGSLWTISVIVQFYLIAWFLYKFFQKKSQKWWLLLFAVSIVLGLIKPIIGIRLPSIIGKLYSQTVFPYLWLFLAGCLISVKYDLIIHTMIKYWWAITLVFVAWRCFVLFDIDIGGYGVLSSLLPCFSGVGFAYAFPNLNIKNDISYGIYIYHMIIINAMIQIGLTGTGYYILIATAFTLMMAYISTITIGKLGLRKKNA